ncbi:MAG: hypothetical protein BMS9Abin09_0062 [Gammaproteobacteria bacterium]|nr:MAG: hypothetical protein BMS9Abin09_0062 [Gammaproteobacteria bacterium]
MNYSDRDGSSSTSGSGSGAARLVINGQRLPGRIFVFCLVLELSFVLLDAVVNYGELSKLGPIQRLFNITREDGLATWFMVTQTFMAALVLWLIFLVHRSHYYGRWKVIAWGFLAGFFTYMSADDGAKIHERMGSVFSELHSSAGSVPSGSLPGRLQAIFPSYDWQLVALPLLAGAGLFMLIFLLRELRDRKEQVLLLLAVGFMAIAVGLDFIEGLDDSHAWNIQVWIREVFDLSKYTVRHFAKSLEEFLEMVAISLLLMLFVRHLIQAVDSRLVVDFHGQQAME